VYVTREHRIPQVVSHNIEGKMREVKNLVRGFYYHSFVLCFF